VRYGRGAVRMLTNAAAQVTDTFEYVGRWARPILFDS
jgi:hypothetical protein